MASKSNSQIWLAGDYLGQEKIAFEVREEPWNLWSWCLLPWFPDEMILKKIRGIAIRLKRIFLGISGLRIGCKGITHHGLGYISYVIKCHEKGIKRPPPVGPWFGGVCVFSAFLNIMTWNFVGVVGGPLRKIFGKKVFRNSR